MKDPSIVVVAQLSIEDEIVSETYRPFGSLGTLGLLKPKIKWSICEGSEKNWVIEVESDVLALNVHFYSKNLDFWADDNYFILSNAKKRIGLRFLEPITKNKIKEKIIVKSLYYLMT